MPNDFSSDPHCIALWNFESGAVPFLADSKGTNTLGNQGVDEDTVDYKQGSCSAAFIQANTDRFLVSDVNLDSGFPLKGGESNKTFSIPIWVKFDSIGSVQILSQKYLSGDSSYRFALGADNKIYIRIYSDGTSYNLYAHETALVAGRWYHVVWTYDNSDYSYRIRIWDDTAHVVVGVDKTGISNDIHIGAATLNIGWNSTGAPDCKMDEFIVFDDVLSVAEIDQITAGTYSGAPVVPSSRALLIGRPDGVYVTKKCITRNFVYN